MKANKIVIGVCRLIFILNGVLLLFLGQWGKGLALLGSLLLTFLPELYRWIGKRQIPEGACMWYVLFIFGCQWLGTYLRFYDKFFWWDILLHFTSGFLLGYIGVIFLMSLDTNYSLFKGKQYLIIAIFAFTFSVMGAALWEIGEYLADEFLGTFTQLGSLKDTMIDIICGTVSALLFAIYTYMRLRKEKDSYITSFIRLNDKEVNVKKFNAK